MLYIEIIKVRDLDVLPNARYTQSHGKWAEKDRNFAVTLTIEPVFMRVTREGVKIIGVIIAFVYGYGGMFAAGNMTLANLYPITASLGMVGYRSYDTAVNWNIGTCSCSLALAVVISAILILCMKEREATQTKKKAKKVAPKKGW